MPEDDRLALIVSGSIAAIKTVPLIKALREKGFDVTVVLRRGPEAWRWVEAKELARVSGHAVLTEDSDHEERKNVLAASAIVLVAPASANIICELAHSLSPLADDIKLARAQGSRLVLAPAMNYKMWQHPAVQRNCALLMSQRAAFLGPAKGPLACGDEGFGRMIDLPLLAEGARSVAEGVFCEAFSVFEEARTEGLAPVAFVPPEDNDSVVLAIAEKNIARDRIERLVDEIMRAGLNVTFVADHRGEGFFGDADRICGEPVITAHYQVAGMDGMEHIRLPEQALCVFAPFLDEGTASAMAQGRADTLCRSLFLASKAPLFTTLEALAALDRDIAQTLCADGVVGVAGVSGLIEAINAGK